MKTLVALLTATAFGLFSFSQAQALDDEAEAIADMMQFQALFAVGMMDLQAANVSQAELEAHMKAIQAQDPKYDLDKDGKITDAEMYKVITGKDLQLN